MVLLVLIAVIVLLLYYASTKKHDYWKKKNVPYEKPLPFFGNYIEYIFLRKAAPKICRELCLKYPKEPYFGTFFGTEPALVIQDPEIIKLVFNKDFYYFNSRELMDYSHREVITQNLFFASGDKWKVVRQSMTPLFTTSKLKNMFYLIDKCAHVFEEMLDYESSTSKALEARSLMIRYTMDCLCSCAFGIETKTMDKNADRNPYLIMGRLIFGSSYYRGFKNFTRAMWPTFFYGLGLQNFPPEINDFFHRLLIGVFESRNYEPTKRNDFVDLVLNLKKSKYIVGDSMKNVKTGGNEKIQLEIDDDMMISECVVFFAAGFETSANALSLVIYELAKNKSVQRRAQEEVDAYLQKHNNKLSYECIKELPFVEACVSEVLRLYPVLGIITREVVENYTFPSGLQLEKGTRVHLPTFHIHRHPDFFPEPESYKPERFLPDADPPIKPYTFFPFGEGPRTCIGMRFSKMQVMPGLITVLKKYNIELAENTPRVLDFESTTLLLQPAAKLRVILTPREGWKERVFSR